MKIFLLIISLLINFFSSNAYANGPEHILNTIKNDPNYSMFYKAIIASELKDLFLLETKYNKTVYIPTDDAFDNIPIELKKKMWNKSGKDILKKIVRTHIYMGSVKEVFKDPKKTVKSYDRYEINGEKVRVYRNSELFVKDMIKKGEETIIAEDVIIPVSCVMFLQRTETDDRVDEYNKNKYDVTSCCLFTDQEVKSFLNDEI